MSFPNKKISILIFCYRRQVSSFIISTVSVPNLFGARHQCSYENLMPNDLKWS